MSTGYREDPRISLGPTEISFHFIPHFIRYMELSKAGFCNLRKYLSPYFAIVYIPSLCVTQRHICTDSVQFSKAHLNTLKLIHEWLTKNKSTVALSRYSYFWIIAFVWFMVWTSSPHEGTKHCSSCYTNYFVSFSPFCVVISFSYLSLSVKTDTVV